MITAYRPRPTAEPYKIKMVEPLKVTTQNYRQQAIKEAHFNTFLLRSEDVYIDLLTDSGTSAMSDYQWSGMMLGDEAYAGSKNFYHLEQMVKRYYGYTYTVPTHQGRAAEHLIAKLLIKPGDIIPGNMYFTTTRAHQELAGGTFQDVIVDEAYDPTSTEPFKGNIDLHKLETLIAQVGEERIPYINVQACVNMAGGQPFSLANLREVRRLCEANGIGVVLDATRALENAWFIQQNEPYQNEKSCAEILKEICDLTDACTMSGKKDLLVNIGGFLALRDKNLYEKACELVVLFEGLHTYGGLAGRDMEAMARGIEEAVEDEHLDSRISQVHYLGKQLLSQGIPVVVPFGGHAIYLDAKRFLNHLPQDQFPAQSLCAHLYVDSGIRAMERGIVSAGRDPITGNHYYPELELVRLTIPRRVYTQAHMDVVADSVIRLYDQRESITGLEMTYEPKTLRFFQARFQPIEQPMSSVEAEFNYKERPLSISLNFDI